jgi:hypothetical protein
MQQRKSAKCDLLHKRPGRLALKLSAMAQRTCQSSFDPKADLGTDYALIAVSAGAALIALIYLILV